MLTRHDDLFAIARTHDGNQAAVGRFGKILLSRDGAKTWQERTSGTTRALSAVHFADQRHGFIVGSGGLILATQDGGLTWSAQFSGTKEQLLGVHAPVPEAAYAVGAFGTLLSTADGGATWRKHEFAWDRSIPRITKEIGMLEPNLNAVCFVTPQTGWIVGEFGLILKTKDRGRTWNSQVYGADRPQLFAVAFLNETVGWSVGQEGMVLRTTNGGQSWTRVDIGARGNLYGVSFQSERGLIVGEGTVYASEDRGSNWTRLAIPAEGHWLSGVTVEGRGAVVVGQGGTIRTVDLQATPFRPEAAAP